EVNGLAPPMFGVYGSQAQAGSFFHHLLPYVEAENQHALGPDAARSHRIAVFLHPGDPTSGNGVVELPTDAPWPGWADSGNRTWGVASYAANFGAFGDRGVKWVEIVD